jgi:hypothetical protein
VYRAASRKIYASASLVERPAVVAAGSIATKDVEPTP